MAYIPVCSLHYFGHQVLNDNSFVILQQMELFKFVAKALTRRVANRFYFSLSANSSQLAN